MNALTISIPGNPTGKGRPRATSRGRFVRMYTDGKTKAKENDISALAKDEMKGTTPWVFPVEIIMSMFFEPPASLSKTRKAAMLRGEEVPDKKPDIDNVIKLVMDALNKVVYADDKQVIRIVASKRYGPQALTVVTVRRCK